VIFDFKSQFVRKGVKLQPGPPPNAPEVRDAGSNTGWIFGTTEDHKNGIPFDIIDFTPPHFNGQLIIHFEKPSPQINEVTQNETHWLELILVLPDRTKRRYIEYKLWDVKLSKLKDEQHLLLESDMIECLTGYSPVVGR
jgi:hypothetical protein